MSTAVSTEAPTPDGTCRRFVPVVVRDEERERRRLVTELAARFPDRSTLEVERAAAQAWRSLDTARVRDFVPVLAMKAAAAQLAASPTTVREAS